MPVALALKNCTSESFNPNNVTIYNFISYMGTKERANGSKATIVSTKEFRVKNILLKLLYNWRKGATSYQELLGRISWQKGNKAVVHHSISKAIFALPSVESTSEKRKRNVFRHCPKLSNREKIESGFIIESIPSHHSLHAHLHQLTADITSSKCQSKSMTSN